MKKTGKKTLLRVLLAMAVCLLCGVTAGGTHLFAKASVKAEAEADAGMTDAAQTPADSGTDYSLFIFFGGILLIVVIAVIAVVAAVSGTAGAIAAEEDEED